MDKTAFGFPFKIGIDGRIASVSGDDDIRAKIIQILFTSPGERVNMPDFGCGLRNMLFEPNNTVLASTAEFNVSKSLERWMGDDILVEAVQVESEDENVVITIVYVRKDSLEKKAVKIAF